MHIFISSLEIVAPMFVYMALGFLARRIRLLGEADCQTMSRLVFFFLLPALLFRLTCTGDFEAALKSAFLPFGLIGVSVLFVLLLFLVPRLEPDRKKRLALFLSNFHVNSTVYGIPLATAILGQEGVSSVGVALGAAVALNNILSVVGAELLQGKGRSTGAALGHLVKNPLIIALVSGAAIGALGGLPDMLYTPISGLASACGPLAFLSLGASFTFASSLEHRKYIVWSIAYRLVLCPLLALGLAAFGLGLRGGELVAVICMFGTPSASSNMTHTLQCGGDGALTGEITVFTTVLSLVSVFLTVMLFKSLGYF